MQISRLLWCAGITFILSASAVAENQSATPDDWVTVEVGDIFSLTAPPGTLYHEGSGIDSIVGTIDAPDFKLSFDYGVYSSSLSNAGNYNNYKSEEVQIDGLAARIVTAYSIEPSSKQPYLIGVHFPKISKSLLGSKKLTIYCFLDSENSYAMVRKIYHTIQLKEKK